MKKFIFLTVAGLILLTAGARLRAQDPVKITAVKHKLTVLWTTGDREVFTKMMYIYILNAKKQNWFEEVTVIVWGPSARLLSGDTEVQEKVKEFQDAGVVMQACIWCTNQYGVTENLKNLGVDVKGMGGPLTRYIKDPETEVLTF